MSGEITITGVICKQYLAKYPTMTSMALARKVRKENPTVFSSIDAARCRLRYYRGQSGALARKKAKDKQFFTYGEYQANPYGLPESHQDEWKPYFLDGIEKGLVISDIHIPYHDIVAVSVALTAGIKHGVREAKDKGVVLINGDLIDFYQLSRFLKDPRKRNAKQEIEDTKRFLGTLREMYPDARIVYKEGNHDARYELYLMRHAEDLFDLLMDKASLAQVTDCFNLGIEYVGEKRYGVLYQLNILHGDEFWTSVSGQVNPARGLFLRAKECALCAHHHQSSEHVEPTIRERQIATWSQGCLCELHPKYMRINKWNHGFVLLDVEGDQWQVFNKRIIKGAIV